MTPVWLFALVLTASPNPHLVSAEDLVAQVRYADAEKALNQARAQQRNPRETLLRILELQGVVAATLGNAAKARTHFQQLLSLAPDRKLPEGQPPRVRTPFYEAKGMASEAAAMSFSAAAETPPEGLTLRARLSADPATLARKARFHVREVGGAWKLTDKPISSGTAVVLPGPGRYEWWAELLGEQDATLFSAGSDDKPFVDGAVSTAPGAAAPVSDVPRVVAPPPKASSGINPVPIVLIGAGGAAAVGGIVAGVLSRSALGKVENAPKDSEGFVTGMTQREAAALRDQAKTQAIAANVLFGAAVALAGTGAVIWLFSGSSSKVAFIPGPGGVLAVGELP